MVLESSAAGVAFTSAISNAIDHAPVPMRDGAPDFDAFIKQLMHEASGLAESHLKDGRDPRALPGYEVIKNTLETTSGAIENGSLTMKGKQALIGVYQNNTSEYVTEREATRFAASSPEDAKKSALGLANSVSAKYLRPLIESAKTAAEVAGRIRSAIADAYQKATQMAQYGNGKDFVPAYAPAQAHGH